MVGVAEEIKRKIIKIGHTNLGAILSTIDIVMWDGIEITLKKPNVINICDLRRENHQVLGRHQKLFGIRTVEIFPDDPGENWYIAYHQSPGVYMEKLPYSLIRTTGLPEGADYKGSDAVYLRGSDSGSMTEDQIRILGGYLVPIAIGAGHRLVSVRAYRLKNRELGREAGFKTVLFANRLGANLIISKEDENTLSSVEDILRNNKP